MNKSYKKNSVDSETLIFSSIDKMTVLYQTILNRHLIKYNSELITNEKDKYLLIDYILNMLHSERETYIIVNRLSLEEMYNCI